MKNLFLLLTTIFAISLTSCGNNKTIIEGYILEAGSDKPIEGAMVEIEYGFSTDIISGNISVIAAVISDKNGYFKWEPIDEDKDRTGWFEIGYISAPNYFDLNWDNSGEYTQIRLDDKYSGTMHLDPYAYLKLHVEDVPEIEGSYCKIFGSYFETEEFNSSFVGYLEPKIIPGNRTTDIYIKYDFIPGSAIQDSIYISANDTLEYFIKY